MTPNLRQRVEALARYAEFSTGIWEWKEGEYLKRADVLALLGAEGDLIARILNHMRDDPFVAWRDTPIEKWAPCMLDLRIRWLSERGDLMRELYTHTTPRGEAT